MSRFTGRLRQTIRDYNFNATDSKLDTLSLALAGMRDGVGPVLTLYLVSQLGLAPIELSWIVAASGLAALCSQTPIGFLYDRVERKSLLLAFGALLMAIACYSMSLTRSVPLLIGLQLLIGVASCFLSIGIPAVCLTFVKNENLPSRFARNELFAKVGNFSALALTGYLMQKLSLSWVFYMVPILAGPVIWSALRLSKPTVVK
ncbi:MAG: MFS transporter, partial [Proteobacteria bacterium]